MLYDALKVTAPEGCTLGKGPRTLVRSFRSPSRVKRDGSATYRPVEAEIIHYGGGDGGDGDRGGMPNR